MIEKSERTDKQISEIAEIERRCFSTPWTESQIKSSDNSTVFFLAKVENKTVGYGGMYTVLDEGYVTTPLNADNFYNYLYGGSTDWTGATDYDGCTVLTSKPTFE